ncbi:MAG: hypothetical protein IV085_00920 [Thiobacillus sp.]|nr:hypothetical protein [Thiobacillus sp.]
MPRLTLTLLLLWGAPVWGATDTHIDPDNGLASWQTEQQGIQIRLTQIAPDQARAFYLARGFSSAATERYVAECVFMTVVRNIGTAPIRHRLADWRYATAGQAPKAIRSKAQWAALWKKLGVDESARIAFTWAQFPATQTFAAGDWNQGMTTYRVARDQPFDLHVRWQADGTMRAATLNNVRCAE